MRSLCAFLMLAAAAWTAEIPRLDKSGPAPRLIVDGKPFVILGGELHNSTASSLGYMRGRVWGQLSNTHLNTVLATVSWELLEPEEGRFDFTLLDGLIAGAREWKMKLVFLWFGSWKNGASTYAPLWVKRDLDRFPRAKDRNGRNTDTLSTFATATRDADARAFAALMRHIRDNDAERTVIMVQVENEVGILGDSRDRSPAAETAFRSPVPRELTGYLQQHRANLLPEIAGLWNGKTSGSWADIFGQGPAADEAFMAWNYARYIDAIAAAGKREYPLPMYVNAWLVQTETQQAGGYPSGGPVSRVMDIWRAGARSIDFLAPDIYLPNFPAIIASYARSGNPLFIPEARNTREAAGNAVYAIGQGAIGFSPFGIDNGGVVAAGYDLLRPILPIITANPGRTAGILEHESAAKDIRLGDYVFTASFGPQSGDPGYGIVIWLGGDDFLMAGSRVALTFGSATPGRTARLGWLEEGRYEGEKWMPERRLNGDETWGGDKGEKIDLPAGGSYRRVRLYQHAER